MRQIRAAMLIQAREYQTEAVQSLWTYFASKSGNPVIAMPTGTGKSVVIASFLETIFRNYPDQKVLILTHVKELIKQNYEKLVDLWPTAPAGIFSSGLNRKDTTFPIIFGGVKSVVDHVNQFGTVHLLVIDEAHLVSPKEETMYGQLIAALKAKNPMLKVIGLTATPWRLGQGKITDDGIFTDICFDITSLAAFNRLIREGYLCPLIPIAPELLLDVTGVHKVGGEFKANELQIAIDKNHITHAALIETMKHGLDRSHWLIFASGIEHAENINLMLNDMGVSSRVVHSRMADKLRDANIADWKAGKYRAVVNNGILTTGIDFPALDLIVMLRPTASTVLWVQMLGRGTRPFPGKENCMVLDFAGNTSRLGPINDPVIPRAKGAGTGEAPIRICESCGMYNHASARYCGGHPYKSPEGCGNEFTFQTKLNTHASTNALIKDDAPVVKTFDVASITYHIHNKPGKPSSLRVSYHCGFQRYTEYVLFEHPGFGRRKAVKWWEDRRSPDYWQTPVPETTAEAFAICTAKVSPIRTPVRVNIWVNTPFPQVMAVYYDRQGETSVLTD